MTQNKHLKVKILSIEFVPKSCHYVKKAISAFYEVFKNVNNDKVRKITVNIEFLNFQTYIK